MAGSKVSPMMQHYLSVKEEYKDGAQRLLILGVRAEHISLGKTGVKAVVSLVEILGNTVNILCKLPNTDIEFAITLQERVSFKVGDEVFVNFSSENLHLFDKESEESIHKFKEEK